MIKEFITYLEVEKQYSKLTIRAYNDDLKQFIEYIGTNCDDFKINEISSTEIRSFVMNLSSQKLKHSSINRKISSIKSLFRFAMRRGVILVDPTKKITLLKKEQRLPSFVTVSTMEQKRVNLTELSNDFDTERNSLIILMFYGTGIRLAELIELRWSDVSFAEREIRVTGKGNKQRIVPLISILEEKLRNYLNICKKKFEIENNFVFLSKKGCRISRSDVYRTVERELTSMDIRGKRSPHILRHTFATHLLNNGAGIETVKELLGHSNLSATQIYTHNNIGTILEKYREAHPRTKK